MGWELHVTRKHLWFDEDGPRIEEAEWHALVAAEPDLAMRLDADMAAALGTEQQMPGTAWYLPDGEETWPLCYDADAGAITGTRPPPHVIRRMWAIAARLGANLQDDDGRRTDRDGTLIPDEDACDPPPARWRRSLWRF